MLLQSGGADSDDVMLARAKYQGQLDEYARYTKEMIYNADKDSKQYYQFKKILGKDAGNLVEFRQMKYNEPKKFELLKKRTDTYSEIDKKEWSSEFKQKSKEAYVRFKKEGIYLSVHALRRLPRLNQPGLPEVSEEILKKFINGIPKYTERENKLVYFDTELQLVAIKNKITGDIVSVVRRKNPKEVWENV